MPLVIRMLRSIVTCSIAVVFLSLFAGPARADIVYDASADFDTINNPSQINGGAYSYGYTDSLGSAFSLLPASFSGSLPGTPGVGSVAGYDLNNSVPIIGKNTGNSVFTTTQNGSTITIQPGQLLLHPGLSGQYADLRFTAPSSGFYSFTGTFNAADSHPTTTDVHVLVNSVTVANGGINVNGGGSIVTLSSPGVALAAGNTIDFVVGIGNGEVSFDSTGFTGQVTSLTSVPEPSSLVLSIIGAAGLFVRSRRRRNA